jgi:hypothetical protein
MTVIISRTCSMLRTLRILLLRRFSTALRGAMDQQGEGLGLLCPQNSGSPSSSSATMQPNDQTSARHSARLVHRLTLSQFIR